MFEYSSSLHLGVDCAVSSWGQGEVAFAFDDDLAVIEEGWESALGEEDDGVLIVSEVVVVFEVCDDLFVVHLAGHEVPFDEAARIVHAGFVFYQIAEAA